MLPRQESNGTSGRLSQAFSKVPSLKMYQHLTKLALALLSLCASSAHHFHDRIAFPSLVSSLMCLLLEVVAAMLQVVEFGRLS